MPNFSRSALNVLLAVLLVAVGFAGGYFLRGELLSAPAAAAAQAPAVTPGAALPPTPSAVDPALLAQVPVLWQDGNTGAKTTVHVFLDWECPFCHQWLQQTYPDLAKRSDLHFVFHNFPLTQIHPHALLGAELALCAADGGWFPEYMREMAALDAVPDDLATQLAARIPQAGSAQALSSCAQGKEAQAKAAESLAAQMGLPGTPAFVVNGHVTAGLMPAQAFDAFLQEAQ